MCIEMGGGLPVYEGWEELAFPARQCTGQRRKGAGAQQQTWRGSPFSHARGARLAPSALWIMNYLPFNASPLLLANRLLLIPPLSPTKVGRHALMINTVKVL